MLGVGLQRRTGKSRPAEGLSLLAKLGSGNGSTRERESRKNYKQIYLACAWCALVFTLWHSQINN